MSHKQHRWKEATQRNRITSCVPSTYCRSPGVQAVSVLPSWRRPATLSAHDHCLHWSESCGWEFSGWSYSPGPWYPREVRAQPCSLYHQDQWRSHPLGMHPVTSKLFFTTVREAHNSTVLILCTYLTDLKKYCLNQVNVFWFCYDYRCTILRTLRFQMMCY